MSLDGSQKYKKEPSEREKRLEKLEYKIMRSSKFEKPPVSYGKQYVFDNFHISITLSGDAGVMYEGHEVASFSEREINPILEKKSNLIKDQFFGEETLHKSQHQGSLNDQLQELYSWANRNGLYDAADQVRKILG